MAYFNDNAKQMICKVVYFGPSYGGKTTNMQWVHQKTAADGSQQIMRLNSENERTESYDFYPVGLGVIRGYSTRLHLFTVPGQVMFDDRRRLLLHGVDGIIFVADSQKARLEENIESLNDLEKNLKLHGLDLSQIPMVIQYNKRDLPAESISSIPELRRALNKYNSPELEAQAGSGIGVFEALNTISNSIVNILKGGDI